MNKTIQEVEQTEVEQIEEEVQSSIQVEGGSTKVEASSLHAELNDSVEDFRVNGFKCAQCGLAHMHDTNKHRATDSFDMTDDEAASMDYNPNCHCGVNELARRGSDFGVDERSAAGTASSAPIPDATTQEMNVKFGGL